MTTKLQTYRCWFLINQNKQQRDYESVEKSAASIFLDFIADKDYGKGLSLFRFDIYAETNVNLGRQVDAIYTGCAHLSIHLDKLTFDKANESEKVKLILNCALVLTKYLATRMPLPKDVQAERIASDYEMYLIEAGLHIKENEFEKLIIKPFDTTKFLFIVTSTIEVKNTDILYDLNEIQDFINNKLAGLTFGSSIRRFEIGYEIFDFKGQFALFGQQTVELRKYGTKNKNLLIVKQFDYAEMKKLDGKTQVNFLKDKILEAILDVDKLNKKPKDFDKEKFYNKMENILTEYLEKHWH